MLIKNFLFHFTKVPQEYKLINENTTIYGCPDCRDGGGMYIEFETINSNKKIYSSIIGVGKPYYIFLSSLLDIIENNSR